MKNKMPRVFSMILAVVMIATTLFAVTGCNPANQTYYDNETDKLVFTTQEVDKVFNPFYATSATDSSVVGMTQIGMLANDENGQPAYGDEEPVVVKDLQIVTQGDYDVDQTTTYYFVLKNDVKFSNGSPLTIKDVLFNLYVYLDPAYTGSSTIYSGYGTSYYFNFTATFDGTTLVFTITKAIDSSAAGKTIEATLSGNTLTITKDYGSNIYTFENSGVLTCPELAVGGGEESETGVDGKTFNGTFNYLDWTSYESYPIDYSISFNADGTTGELVCDGFPYVIDGCNLTFTYTFDGTTVIMTITGGDLASAIGETVEATVDGNTMTVTKDFGSSEYDLEGTTATC